MKNKKIIEMEGSRQRLGGRESAVGCRRVVWGVLVMELLYLDCAFDHMNVHM